MYKKIANRVAQERGTTVIKKLGSGGQGVAYLLSDGTVCKVTGQLEEYNVSSALVGKEYEGINRIYKTYKVNTNVGWNDGYYAIIQEKLNVENVEEEIIEFRGFINSNFDTDYYHDIFNKFVEQGSFNNVLFKEIRQKVSESEKPFYVDILDQLAIITKSCIEIGMVNTDMLPCNLGRKDGKLVMFDLGYSRSHSGSVGIEIILE